MFMVRLTLALLLAVAIPAQEVSQSGLELRAERPMVAQPAQAHSGMVASTHEIASRVGVEVLQRGGNAVDAAVAVAFALAVVHPEAGNLGGGGYMLIRMADGREKAIDYRETAPAAARPGMFATPHDARVGYRASAVPGTVAGMWAAHKLFGTQSWQSLLLPSERLARRGFPASQRMELILALQVPVMRNFPDSRRIFLHGTGRPIVQGESLIQLDLARTIHRIAHRGAREFYEGETAQLIAADMKRNGGTITLEDLEAYQPVVREPLHGTYRECPVLTIPPSSCGGMTLLEMLNILERFPMPLGMEGSSYSRHLEVEAMRRAYRDRLLYAADPAFHKVPVEMIISKQHAAELARTIALNRATPSRELGPTPAAPVRGESGDTTHFTIVDKYGNIVTNTYTLNGFYGSQVIAKGTGVLLNDIMAAFSRTWATNEIEPGKRPVSSMAPTIVLHPDGSPWFALGSPGAYTIPNTVFQVIVNIIDFKMSLRDAIGWPRIHHQYLPDRIDAEPGALVADVAEKLKSYGHVLNPKLRSQGDVHAILLDASGRRLGWADGRRGGHALGY